MINGYVEHLFQGGKEEEYSGANRRKDDDRIELPPEQEKFLQAIKKAVGSCGDCIIPKDARSSVDHLFGTIKEIGNGSHAEGINEGRDQHKAVKGILKTATMAKNLVLKVVLISLVGGAIGWLVYGFKAGVNG